MVSITRLDGISKFFVAIAFLFLLTACKARTLNEKRKLNETELKHENQNRIGWKCKNQPDFDKLSPYFQQSRIEERKKCSIDFLSKWLLRPLLEQNALDNHKAAIRDIVPRIQEYQNACKEQLFLTAIQPDSEYIYRNVYLRFQNEKDLFAYCDSQQNYDRAVGFKHPLERIPTGLPKSYEIWFEKFRTAEAKHEEPFDLLQVFEMELFWEVIGANSRSPHLINALETKVESGVTKKINTIEGSTALLGDLLALKGWNERDVLNRAMASAFFQKIRDEERKSGFIGTKTLKSNLSSFEFLQMVSQGYLPIDVVFEDSSSPLTSSFGHPVHTHRLQMLALSRFWKSQGGPSLKQGQSCFEFDYEVPRCPAHLYRMLGVVQLDSRLNLDFSATGYSPKPAKNLWTPLFDLENGALGFWRPLYFRQDPNGKEPSIPLPSIAYAMSVNSDAYEK
jgi:hypothetical protein